MNLLSRIRKPLGWPSRVVFTIAVTLSDVHIWRHLDWLTSLTVTVAFAFGVFYMFVTDELLEKVSVPTFSLELLDPLPSHDAWKQMLNAEALKRENGNYRLAAASIGVSQSYLRRSVNAKV